MIDLDNSAWIQKKLAITFPTDFTDFPFLQKPAALSAVLSLECSGESMFHRQLCIVVDTSQEMSTQPLIRGYDCVYSAL